MSNKKSKNQLAPITESILESISDGVFTVDENWRVTSFNRAAEKITNLSKDEAIGSLCSEVFKSSMCEKECALRRTLKSGKPIINQSGFIINANGEKIPVSVSTAVLKDENGNVIGGAETFRDLSEVVALRNELHGHYSIGDFKSRSKAMNDVFELARAVADSPSTVLIIGDTGTGKEVLAKAIHEMSGRKSEPFIAINCGALPDTLLESELFGFKKGAFTGADRDKPGRFALAKKGTLFLDEIGEVSPALQVRLLRVLQERTYEPLGATKTETTQARIIAATHRNIKQMVSEGTFRQDLYYRINIMSLHIPPLCERKEDIPILADHFVHKYNKLQGRDVPGISTKVYEKFIEYSWPGNVRELENIIERAFVLCGTNPISIEHIPSDLGHTRENTNTPSINHIKNNSERSAIIAALEKNWYNQTKTAQELGIHKTTLYRKMKKLGINTP